MRFENIRTEINHLPVITKNNLRLLQDNNNNAFDACIKRWLKKKLLIKLKNGHYVTKEYIDRENDMELYNEFVACQMIFPSYLSREYVLQKYNVLTEATYGYSLVTNRKTKKIENDLSFYSYAYIKNDLFCGFYEKRYHQNVYFTATKAKALFDFIYFRKRLLKEVTPRTVEDLRIDLDGFDEDDFFEFESYLDIVKSPKMQKVYDIMRAGE